MLRMADPHSPLGEDRFGKKGEKWNRFFPTEQYSNMKIEKESDVNEYYYKYSTLISLEWLTSIEVWP